MTGETLTTEDEKPSHRWGRAEWGPFALFVYHLVLMAIFLWTGPPTGGFWNDPVINDLFVAGIGAIAVLPLLCSLWAALAPSPLITRLPSSLAALVLWIFLLPNVKTSFLEEFVLRGGFFFIYWAGLSMMRRAGGGVLVTSIANLCCTRSIFRFKIKDLLFLTTLVALLLTIGRYLGVGEAGILDSSRSIWLVVGGHLLLAGGHAILLFPIFIVGLFMLISSKRTLVRVAKRIFWLLLFYAIILTAYQIKGETSPSSRLLMPLINFYIGAMLTMALSAVVLRWSGYRLVRNMIYPLSTQAHPVEAADDRGESR